MGLPLLGASTLGRLGVGASLLDAFGATGLVVDRAQLGIGFGVLLGDLAFKRLVLRGFTRLRVLFLPKRAFERRQLLRIERPKLTRQAQPLLAQLAVRHRHRIAWREGQDDRQFLERLAVGLIRDQAFRFLPVPLEGFLGGLSESRR